MLTDIFRWPPEEANSTPTPLKKAVVLNSILQAAFHEIDDCAKTFC
jgi:hypothetical protein